VGAQPGQRGSAEMRSRRLANASVRQPGHEFAEFGATASATVPLKHTQAGFEPPCLLTRACAYA
jgi:hypothetical protein